MENRIDHYKKLGELIKDIRIAMLTTRHGDGSLRSRPMATQKTQFDGDLWFFTDVKSGKTVDIEAHPEVNVSYSSPDSNTFISVSGRAQLVENPELAKELWSPLMVAWFPGGLGDPSLGLLKVRVDGAEYWDFSSSAMVQVAGFVKAVATGKKYEAKPGEHQKISL